MTMWRWLLGVLVVANLFMMLLWRGNLDGVFTRGREPDRVQQQMNADRLRVIRERRPDGARDGDGRDDGANPAARPSAGHGTRGSDARTDARIEARSGARTDARIEARSEPDMANRGAAAAAAIVGTALVPSPTRTPPAIAGETCLEFGALDESRARRARAWLADNVPAVSGEVLHEERLSWIVYVAPAASYADAQLRASLLRKQGIEDLFVWQDGPLKHGVSLGVFRSEEGARAAVEHYNRQGVRNVLVTRRGSPDSKVAVRVRYSTRAAEATGTPARLSQLQRELATEPQPCGSRPTVAVAGR